jgi:hypothetical protein
MPIMKCSARALENKGAVGFFKPVLKAELARCLFCNAGSFALFLLLVGLNGISARDPYFVAYRTDNGLPHDNVYDIFEDSKGYMWLALETGLYRYDGQRFTLFRIPGQSTYGGTNIQEDEQGRVWYINFDGYLYYVENGRLIQFNLHRPSYFVPYGLGKQHLFTVDDYGVNAYRLTDFEPVFRYSFGATADNVVYHNGFFYVLSKDKLYSFSDKDFSLNSVSIEAISFPRIITATDSGVAVLSRFKQSPGAIRYTNQLVPLDTLNFSHDFSVQGGMQEGNVFHLFSPSGLFSLDLREKNLNSRFLGYNVTRLFRDSMGNYWLGTIGTGVLFIPNWSSNFYVFGAISPTRIVRTVNGYLLGTMRDGVWELGTDFSLKQQLHSFSGGGDIQHLFYDWETDLYSAYAQGMIIGQFRKRLWREVSVAVKGFQRLDHLYFAVGGSNFCGLYKLDNKESTASPPSNWDELYRLNLNSTNTTGFVPVVPNLRARAVAVKPQDSCFFCATNQGLIRVYPGSHEEIRKDGNAIYGASLAWHKGRLWVLQAGGLLLAWKPEGRWYELNTGASGESAGFRFLQQDRGRLLLGSDEFLYVSETGKRGIEKYRMPLGSHLIKDVLVADSLLVLLTNMGILVSTLNDLKNPVPLPRFYLHQLEAGGQSHSIENPIRLKAFDNEVKVYFSLLNFNSAKPSNVYYSLNERDWIPADSRQGQIQFSSLSPGNYTLKFKVDNQELTEKVDFVILTPYWLQPFFFISIALAVSGLGFIFFRLRTTRFKKQLSWLEEKVELEKSLSNSMLTSIRAQMNPHFFYNALNTIQAYIYTNDRRNASAYLSKFSRLTRLVLEMSDKERVYLLEELEALRLYLELERMRFQTDLEVNFKVHDDVESEFITLPPMLIQPYVENAFKHGLMHREGLKCLYVSFSRDKDNLIVIVEDNGIGRAAAAKVSVERADTHQPFATRANQKRLELINRNRSRKVFVHLEDLIDEFGLALGTRVKLTIPIDVS